MNAQLRYSGPIVAQIFNEFVMRKNRFAPDVQTGIRLIVSMRKG